MAGSGFVFGHGWPELDILTFLTGNIAAELILGTTYANIAGEGTIGELGDIVRFGCCQQ